MVYCILKVLGLVDTDYDLSIFFPRTEYSFIHLFSVQLVLSWVAGVLEPISATNGQTYFIC